MSEAREVDGSNAVSPELLNEIRTLEETLHRQEMRRSRAVVEGLLCEEFVEFGSSGTVYQREEMIALLEREDENKGDGAALLAYDYSLSPISLNAVLLTYRTCRKNVDGTERHVLRSSIWKHSETGWKMMFHQGTRTRLREA